MSSVSLQHKYVQWIYVGIKLITFEIYLIRKDTHLDPELQKNISDSIHLLKFTVLVIIASTAKKKKTHKQ